MASEDVETGAATATFPAYVAESSKGEASSSRVIVLECLDAYDGETVAEKVDDCIGKLPVVVVIKTYCPFCKDSTQFLAVQLGVTIRVLPINEMKEGDQIFKHLSNKENHRTVPMIYVRGTFLGGCDRLRALQQKGDLEKDYLRGLIGRKRTEGAKALETSKLLPPYRVQAIMPFFWFPNVVNNNIERVTSLQVFIMSVVSCTFFNERWAHYIAVGLVVDFFLRLLAGSSVSPLGMTATVVTVFWEPDFCPGPPKQFAAFCGAFFSLGAFSFYFVDFPYHESIGAVWIGILAVTSGMEGKNVHVVLLICLAATELFSRCNNIDSTFLLVVASICRVKASSWFANVSLFLFFKAFVDFCLGCLFFNYGVRCGIFPDYVYRIYTQTRQETVDSWKFQFHDSVVHAPVKVDTDPRSPISLKYKKKCKSTKTLIEKQ